VKRWETMVNAIYKCKQWKAKAVSEVREVDYSTANFTLPPFVPRSPMKIAF